jgi:hypothetical protein
MLDDQRDATFIIIDAAQLACASQATLDLLGNLRRSQKPVSPLWIDECIRRGTVVDLDKYIIRTSPTAPPIMRQPTAEKSIDTEVLHKSGEKPTDIEVPDRQAPPALGDTISFERKRRLSQSEVNLANDVVRPTGIIRKAVDPRVRPRPSAERQASNSEISTRLATSISKSVLTTNSPGVLGEKRGLSRSSVYDRPDATTLDHPLTRTAPAATEDDGYKVADCSSQVTPRGVNMVSHPIRSKKPSFPNAAAETVPSPQPARTYRPDTPPLPPNLSISIGRPPSHDLALVSMVAPDMPQSLGPATSSSPEPRPEAPRPQSSVHNDHVSELTSPSSSELSAYVSPSDDETTPHTLLGGPGASSRLPPIPKFMIPESGGELALLTRSGQRTQGTPSLVATLVSRARLGELVDELDKWLNTEPTDTPFLFLKALDAKVSPF